MLKIVRILIYFSFTSVFAQIDMFNTLEKTYSLDLDAENFPKLKFEWNFDGKVQGSVNAGLTELLDNKDYEKAFLHFDEAIVKMPTCLPAFYYRGICYKIQKKYAEAKEDLSKASALAPHSPEILLELGESYEELWEYAAAEKTYEKIMENHPGFASAYFNLANLSMRQGNYPKATRYFKKCIEADPRFIESHVRQGILGWYMDKRGSKTIPHFDNALAIDSTFQAALFWRGMMYLRDKNVEKCLENWTKLVVYNPEKPLFVMLRAFLYLDLKDYENAFVDLKNVFSKNYTDENSFRGAQSTKDKRLDLQFAVSYMTRTIYGLDEQPGKHIKTGFCYLVMERGDEAIGEFKKSFKLQPSAVSLFLRGLTYEHSKRHDSAFVYYNEALKYDNDIFDAHKKRAIYFSELKDWRKAYTDFEEMVRLEPGFTVTYRLRSMIRIQFKDYYGAILDLTKYVSLDSSDFEIFLYRAYCKKAVKDLKGASMDYRKALEINPDHYELYQNVIDSDLESKDTLHALETIALCEKEFGPDTYLFSTRVRIYVAQKKFKDARTELQTAMDNKTWLALQKESQHSLLHYLDGWIDYLENDFDNALRKLNKAVSYNDRNFDALYLRSKMYIKQGEKMKAMRDLKLLAEVGYADSNTLLNSLR